LCSALFARLQLGSAEQGRHANDAVRSVQGCGAPGRRRMKVGGWPAWAITPLNLQSLNARNSPWRRAMRQAIPRGALGSAALAVDCEAVCADEPLSRVDADQRDVPAMA